MAATKLRSPTEAQPSAWWNRTLPTNSVAPSASSCLPCSCSSSSHGLASPNHSGGRRSDRFMPTRPFRTTGADAYFRCSTRLSGKITPAGALP